MLSYIINKVYAFEVQTSVKRHQTEGLVLLRKRISQQ